MPETEPTLQAMVWPADGRPMLRLPGGLWVDEAPVTHGEYARFIAATGHPAPRRWQDGVPAADRLATPVVDIDIEDARAWARWAGKRLPLQWEWQRAVFAVDFHAHLGGGHVWEWTGSPHREGHVVRGGPYRNQPGTRGQARHRSWEDAPAKDLGFRCVADHSALDLPPLTAEATELVDHAVAATADGIDARRDAIHTTARGVAVVGAGVVVHVDVADLELLLRAPGHQRRLGATSAGLLLAITTIQRLTGQRHPDHAVLAAIDDALTWHALRVRPELAATRSAMQAMGLEPGPLLRSRGVVMRPHVVKDLTRLRPAGIALQMLDAREDDDDTSPEYAALLAETVINWSRLYQHPESTQRSVNRTLALFGDDATPTALWGLRGLPLRAPVASLQHLEVLGHVALMVQNPDELRLRREIIERATDSELGEALVLVDEGEIITRQAWQAPAGRLAEILGAISVFQLRQHLGRRPRFRELLEEALHALRHVLRLRTLVAEPPIPPPAVAGVRFLATVAEIADEGVRMDHCVATRAPRALAGQSYLFHVAHEGEGATAEVLASGAIAEVRGPRNGPNGACRRARLILRPWGRLVGVLQQATATPQVAANDAAPTPAGLRLLRTPQALVDAALALLPGTEDHGGALAAFVEELAIALAAGRARAALDGDGFIVRLDDAGQVVASSRDLDAFGGATPTEGHLLPQVLGPYDADPDEAPPGWYDDDDNEWDMRT